MAENRLFMSVVGILMFAGWTGAYLAIFRQCFQDRTYGIPIASACFNIWWEFFYAFDVIAQLPSDMVHFPLHWGNRMWFVFDTVIIWQILRYGRKEQDVRWVRANFYSIVSGNLLLSGAVLYLFIWYFKDLYGVASSMLMDVSMAAFFFGMLFRRADLRGLSYAGAWLMLVGNAAGFIFIYYWWPNQFADGWLKGHPDVPEPSGYAFLNLLYIVAVALNGLYIYLLYQRRAALASNAHPRAAVVI